MKLSHPFPRVSEDARLKIEKALDGGCYCGGDSARMTKRFINKGKGLTVHIQCETCGRSLIGSMKRIEHFRADDYPDWNEQLRYQYNEIQHLDREKYAEERRKAYIEARKNYRNNFLWSNEWRCLRQRVLIRDRFLCQACLSAGATDVHHQRYGLDCLPPAWDLKSVCRSCHDNLHGNSAAWTGK